MDYCQRIALQVTFKLIIRFYSFLANYPPIDDISKPPASFESGWGLFIYKTIYKTTHKIILFYR